MTKIMSAYKTIGEVAQEIGLVDKRKKKLSTHTIRYWEKEFKEIKPKIFNKRRYYDKKNVNLIIKINFLLKNQGLTISGVKKYLNNEKINIDNNENEIINSNRIKIRINRIAKLIKDIKK